MNTNTNDRLIFMDLETTGLDPDKNEILEVACVITDKDLIELAVYEEIVAVPDPENVHKRFSPFIMKMHGKAEPPVYYKPSPGTLLSALPAAQKELHDIQKDLLQIFASVGVVPMEGILSGSSIHFDRAFMKKGMPLLEAFFYHRMFDVSALKTAAQMWAPHLVPPPPKDHRALADVRSSIKLAKHFYEKLFHQPNRLADVACDLIRQSISQVLTPRELNKLEEVLANYDPNWSTR